MVERVTNNGVHDVKEQYGQLSSSSRERDVGVLVGVYSHSHSF